MKTVVGLFDTSSDAFAAQNELLAAGLSRDRISVITSQKNKDYRTDFPKDRSEAGEGAGIGVVAGALLGGALASLGLFAIPGVGPLLGTGALVTTLAGAGTGAVAGGLIGGLVGLGIPAHEAEMYEEGVMRGGVLLSVDSSDRDADRVAMILSQHHAVDIDRRALEWEKGGWVRKRATLPNAGGTGMSNVASSGATTGSGATAPLAGTPASTVDPRLRGLERPEGTGSKGIGGTGAGSLGRTSSARIYNP